MEPPLSAVCEAFPPPCDDEDNWCWKCLVLNLAIERAKVAEEREAYKVAWERSDEAQLAAERLAEHATKEALRARPVVQGYPTWVPVVTLIGGLVLGVLVGGGIAAFRK